MIDALQLELISIYKTMLTNFCCSFYGVSETGSALESENGHTHIKLIRR